MNAEKRDEAERIPNLPSNTHPEKKYPTSPIVLNERETVACCYLVRQLNASSQCGWHLNEMVFQFMACFVLLASLI